MTAYFDSHLHLDFDVFDAERTRVIEEAAVAGVGKMLVPGTEPGAWRKMRALIASNWGYERELPVMLRVGLGLHPYWSADVPTENRGAMDALIAELRDLVVQLGAVAIGEMGVDKNKGAPPPQQIALLEAQLALARELDLPLVLHQVGLRDAFLKSLQRVGLPEARGVVHGFSGDVAWAKALTKMGLFLGVGAGILAPARDRLRETVAGMALGDILIETDAPDGRVRRPEPDAPPIFSEPSDVVRVAARLAELHVVPEHEVARITGKSASRLFGF